MVERTNIALIGVGAIGLRHLQSLTTLSSNIHIEVVDPSHKALQNVKSQVQLTHNNIRLLSKIADLSPTIDIAIIATTATVRRQVTEELLRRKNIKYLILEKVLFQRLEDYDVIKQLFDRSNVKAWVNCPLRLHPFFQKLKEKISPNSKIQYFASGTYLGIGCNTIHHLDLLAYLCNESHISFDTTKLDKRLIYSKREGFVEFTGTLLGEMKEGSLLKITSYSNDVTRPLILQINCEEFYCSINITEQKYELLDKNHHCRKEEGEYRLLLQSEITSEVVQEILQTGACQLTSYEQSMKLHKAMIEAFLQFLQQVRNEEVTICPIT